MYKIKLLETNDGDENDEDLLLWITIIIIKIVIISNKTIIIQTENLRLE